MGEDKIGVFIPRFVCLGEQGVAVGAVGGGGRRNTHFAAVGKIMAAGR